MIIPQRIKGRIEEISEPGQSTEGSIALRPLFIFELGVHCANSFIVLQRISVSKK